MRSYLMNKKKMPARITADMTSVLIVTGCLMVAVPARAQTTLYTLIGDSAGDFFGNSVGGVGDVNGDGVPDVIVGAPRDDPNGDISGRAQVFSGIDGSLLYTFDGDSPGDGFGWSTSGAGDVNGDGVPDFIVGAFSAGIGYARVFSGADGGVIWTFIGDTADDQFGRRSSGAGDVDGDGFADLIVGAQNDNTNARRSGLARVFSGKTGLPLYNFHGDSFGDSLGGSVSGAGDVNGDGHADLIVGIPLDSPNGTFSGSVRVFSGADGSILYTFEGDSQSYQLGGAVSGAGDVNGDGFPDLIVGAIGASVNGTNSGSVRVFSGRNGAVLYTFNGDSAFDHFGRSVSGAGDVNGDGFADLIVGGIGGGMGARVFSGSTGTILYTLVGDSIGDNFGSSVSGVGDVDGDGFADLIVGAFRDFNSPDSGSARVISGRPQTSILLDQLVEDVILLNLSVGIVNSLDAKLDAILRTLNDMAGGNDRATVLMLESFITQVESQSGKQISVEDAEALIAAAQAVIDLLLSGG